MLSSNGTQATIQYFLNLVKAQSPEVSPNIFMTDRDQAQVNSIRAVFSECRRVFYCWWHVLRAIWTHFNTKEFPELWSLIQDWVRTTDENQFNTSWKYIEEDTSLGIGSPTKICGPRCHAIIGRSLRREIQICFWKRMLSFSPHKKKKFLN